MPDYDETRGHTESDIVIYGIGTDIVTIKRIDEVHQKHGERFLHRILCEAEIADYNVLVEQERLAKNHETQALARRLSTFLAKRFAVKEAFSKAFGTGIGEAVNWHDVRVTHDLVGKPSLAVSDALQAKLAAKQICAMHVSISDEMEHAIAFVVLETDAGANTITITNTRV